MAVLSLLFHCHVVVSAIQCTRLKNSPSLGLRSHGSGKEAPRRRLGAAVAVGRLLRQPALGHPASARPEGSQEGFPVEGQEWVGPIGSPTANPEEAGGRPLRASPPAEGGRREDAPWTQLVPNPIVFARCLRQRDRWGNGALWQMSWMGQGLECVGEQVRSGRANERLVSRAPRH